MTNRRRFIQHMAGAAAGTYFGAGALAEAVLAQAAGGRRTVTIGGKRIRVIDIHAHCVIPEAINVYKDPKLQAFIKEHTVRPFPLNLDDQRLRVMNEGGIDIQALSINAFWYGMERGPVTDLINAQNEGMAKWCSTHSDRFVAFASVALQFPDLAVQQMESAVKKFGMKGAAIGGSVEGDNLGAPKYDPFWAKAQELGVLLYNHPLDAPHTTLNPRLHNVKGRLENIIGNPLETTLFLQNLIFEGVFDRFPGLRICASHGGGFFGSYNSRSEALCARASGGDCRALKKKPGEYLRQEIATDSMVFDDNHLKHLIAETGINQVMYGTDYPFDWPVGVDFILNASYLSDADKTAILGGNAARMLKM